MKILHVCRQFYPCIGGVENFVLNLAREQIKDGHSVMVLTLDRSFSDNAAFASNEEYRGIAIRRVPFFGSRRYPIAFSAVDFLNIHDIVHIHCVDFFIDYLVLLKFLHKKRIVLHTHGGFFHTKKFRLLKKIYFNTITRIILRGCDRVIACSKNDYDLFRRISRKVVRIDNGVDIKTFSGIKKNIEQATLLYVGRIDEHKRIDNVIRAVETLKRRGIDTTLRILGPEWRGMGPALRALAGQLGIEDKVVFLGKTPEDVLMNELSRAHLFVSASEYEAFGISAVEAMTSGTLCVLNDIEAFRNIIEFGRSGYIVDYSHTEDAAECLMRAFSLSEVDYIRMTTEAKNDAKRYSWDSAAKEIMKIYHEILEERPDAVAPSRISMLGVSIDNISFRDALAAIARHIENNDNVLVATPNVHHLILLQNDADFRKIYNALSLALPDGMPLIWASKFLGTPLREKISGADLFPKLCEEAAGKGYRLFFLGGREGAAAKAVEILKARYSGLNIVGHYSPPFSFENNRAENDKIIKMIKDAKPDILFVGLGAPKQEKWIYKYKDAYGVPVSIGIGVSFEFVSGMVKRAPRWMQKCGMEWLWRLAMEPKRLWKRYLVEDMRFFWLVFRQKFFAGRK